MNAKRRGFQLTNLILKFEAEPMTFASGVQNQQSALYGLPSTNPLKSLNRPIKPFVIVEIKLA